MSEKQFLDYEGLKTFKNQLDLYIDKNKTVVFNYSLDVDKDGNLVIIYPDGESAPQGFSVDSNGYLVYNS